MFYYSYKRAFHVILKRHIDDTMSKCDTVSSLGILEEVLTQGGYSGILVTGMGEWGEIVRPKKSPSG